MKRYAMISLLIEFVKTCDRVNLTPSEKHIDAFLNSVGEYRYRDRFIRFCFYEWENRDNKINELLN